MRTNDELRTIDEASGGRWQRFDDASSNLRDKVDETAGLHSLFREGLAADAEEQALLKACFDVLHGAHSVMD